MHRFFVDDSQKEDYQIRIIGEDQIHMTKSLRMKIKEKVEISNGKGREYLAEIVDISKEEVLLHIVEEKENCTEPPIEINLYQGIPKGPKMDLIIQKSVELGVTNIHPVITHRTIVEIEKKGNKKLERWQKIAEEAAKQSKRGIIPKVNPIGKVKDLEEKIAGNDITLIAYEEEEEVSLKERLLQNEGAKKIGIIIGPEGGLAKEEVDFLCSLGGLPFSLGRRILRTETAGISAISMLLYHFEQ